MNLEALSHVRPDNFPDVRARNIRCWLSVSEQGGKNGGAEEDRTPDLLRARQALSQLSYGPFFICRDNL